MVDPCDIVDEVQVSETMDNILDVHALHKDQGDIDSQVFMTTIDNENTEHDSVLTGGWGQHMSKDFVNAQLNWIGYKNILQRQRGSLIVMTINSRGRTDPGPDQDKIKDKCRLPHLAAMVTSGLVDILVVCEANLNEEQARCATRLVKHSSGGRVRAHSAPTSTAVSTMENILAGSPVT